jgi:Flp pilus assembly protein TadG
MNSKQQFTGRHAQSRWRELWAGAAGLLGDEGGNALVEFALFLTVLVFILVGVVDYSMYLQEAMQIQEAASAGASFAAVPGNESNFTAIEAAATSAAPGVSGLSATATNVWRCTPSGASVTSTSLCTGNVTPYKYVVVSTSATVSRLLYFPRITTSLALHGSATFRVPWSQ